MLSAVKLQASNPAITPKPIRHLTSICKDLSINRRSSLRPQRRPLHLLVVRSTHVSATSSLLFSSASAETSKPSFSSRFTTSVGSPPLQPSQWNLNQRHVLLLNVIACAAAVSATWLFLAAIPALLAFKRAAESLEKLMDVTREELPDTMAAIRLSGMEISDLTMELSDLGQEITQGVRSSTKAVRLAEDRLRSLTNIAPASMQEVTQPKKMEETGPVAARTARNLREVLVKGRAIWQMVFTITRFSRIAFSYFAKRAKG